MLVLQTDSSPFTPDQEHHRTIPAFVGHRQSDDGAAHSGDNAELTTLAASGGF